jgi:hypothetical protein
MRLQFSGIVPRSVIMSVTAIATRVLPDSLATGNLSTRPRPSRGTPQEPVYAEYTVIEGEMASSNRKRSAARGTGGSRSRHGMRLLSARSHDDPARLGVLKAYLPYQDYLGLCVDLLV